MSITADDTGIYIVEESVAGTTPASPVWLTLPVVSESLATNANTTISNTLNPQRQVLDSVLTGMDVSGSLEVEFARTNAMDLLIQSAMGSVWDDTDAPVRKLSVESTKLTFSIMKRWPEPDVPDEYIYQIYKGCTVNTFSITMTAGAEVTCSIGIVGKTVDADRDTAQPDGSTYPALGDFEVLRAPEVKSIILDNEDNTLAAELEGSCVTDMTLNINANVRGIQCLGTLGNKSVVLGRFELSHDVTIFFNDNNIMSEFLHQNILTLQYVVGDAGTPDHYAFTLPKTKVSTETVVAEGTGTDVVNQLTLQGLVDPTLTPQTSLIIETIVQGTDSPIFVSGVVENAAPNDVVITFSEDVVIADSTGISIMVNGVGATINAQVAAASAITFTLSAPVTSGQTVTFQADGTNTITDATDGLPLIEMDNARTVTNNVV